MVRGTFGCFVEAYRKIRCRACGTQFNERSDTVLFHERYIAADPAS